MFEEKSADANGDFGEEGGKVGGRSEGAVNKVVEAGEESED